MTVVTTGVHLARRAGCKSEPRFLMDRQRVHVAAQQDRPARPGAVEAGDEAAGRPAIPKGQRQAGERGLQLLGRSRTIEAEFGFGVDGAAGRGVRLVVAIPADAAQDRAAPQ